jgi:hypothetical protein
MQNYQLLGKLVAFVVALECVSYRSTSFGWEQLTMNTG